MFESFLENYGPLRRPVATLVRVASGGSQSGVRLRRVDCLGTLGNASCGKFGG